MYEKLYFNTVFLINWAAQQQTVSIQSNHLEETTSITITINGSTVDEAAWELRKCSLYMDLVFDTNDATVAIVQVMAHGQRLMK
jgi:hypothetical protein